MGSHPFELGKQKGAFRTITSLNICDAVVYRHIADAALQLALPHKVRGAFFSRRHSATPVGDTIAISDEDPYHKFYEIWMRYNEYRSRTFLNQPYSCLVITDITNYFDSIQHDLLIEYLAPLGLPRKAMGVLGRLIEAFKPPAGHSPNPRVGLPLDELDCSRQLAHVFLFEHDRRIAQTFGESNYVRWMDDQNVGVTSEREARRVVNVMTRSLSSQRLTLNAGKTRFLTVDQIVVHFQLDANKRISQWETEYKTVNDKNKAVARAALESLWNEVSSSDCADQGNWDKILKRFYGLAMKVDSAILEPRALSDLIYHSELDERIFRYYAQRNRFQELYELFSEYSENGENLFEATEAIFFDSTLLLDPDPVYLKKYKEMALRFSKKTSQKRYQRPLGISNAILALYWFDVDVDVLLQLYPMGRARRLPKEAARSWMAVIAALNPERLSEVLTLLFGHPSDDGARLAHFLTELLSGRIEALGNYKLLKSRWPLPGKYYDARSWLVLDLAAASNNKELKGRSRRDLSVFTKYTRTESERTVLDRINRKVGG